MKKSINRKLFFIALVAVAIFYTACQEEYENITTSGKLRVMLTDAPFPADLVAEANVTITKIELRKADDEEGNPFVVLSEEETPFNLLDLTNGVTAILVDTALESGTYSQIRLYVADPGIKLKDGEEFDLKVPGGAQSGIKIHLNPAITVGGEEDTDILLDFDVSKSFVVQGNPNTPAGIKGFIFKPVIKATEPDETGILKGNVTDTLDVAIANAQVSILAADTVYATSFTEENGDYAILGVEPGTFKVEFSKEGYTSLTVEDVEIEAGETTKVKAKLIAVENN